MKKIVHSFILTAVFVVLAVSCNKDKSLVSDEGDTIIVTVNDTYIADDSDTRTSLSGLATHWCVGDSIKLYDTDGHYAYYSYLKSADGEPGKAKFVRLPGGDGFIMSKFSAAYYPARNVISFNTETKKFTATAPSVQKYVAGSFDNGSAPMMSYTKTTESDGIHISFSNLFAVIDVSVIGFGTVSSIELSSSSCNLSGRFIFSYDEDLNDFRVVDPFTGDLKKVTLDCGSSGVPLSSTATSFLIPIPVPYEYEICFNTNSIDPRINIPVFNKQDEVRGTMNERSYLTAKIIFKEGSLPSAIMSATVEAYDPIYKNWRTTFSNQFEYPHYLDGTADRGVGILIDDVIWAPVNCGYDPLEYPFGKLYQFGRKVGGGYNDGSANTEEEQTATAAIYDPDGYNKSPEDTTFYYCTSSPYDWYNDSSDTDLQLSEWPMTSPSGTFGIGNPCPSGWRVPTLDELGSLCYTDWNSSSHSGTTTRGEWDSTNKGWKYSDSLFLPAAGYREHGDGIAYSRGSAGDYWSSSVGGTNAWRLFFGSGFAVLGREFRVHGYSVRCVQE